MRVERKSVSIWYPSVLIPLVVPTDAAEGLGLSQGTGFFPNLLKTPVTRLPSEWVVLITTILVKYLSVQNDDPDGEKREIYKKETMALIDTVFNPYIRGIFNILDLVVKNIKAGNEIRGPQRIDARNFIKEILKMLRSDSPFAYSFEEPTNFFFLKDVKTIVLRILEVATKTGVRQTKWSALNGTTTSGQLNNFVEQEQLLERPSTRSNLSQFSQGQSYLANVELRKANKIADLKKRDAQRDRAQRKLAKPSAFTKPAEKEGGRPAQIPQPRMRLMKDFKKKD